MTPEELTGAARNLADGLGIPVYIREGRIYQNGPGVEFLPRQGCGSTAPGIPHLREDTSTPRAAPDWSDRTYGHRVDSFFMG